MFETILSWPLAAVIPVLWGIAMLRGNATYWIARASNSGYRRLRADRRQIPAYERAVSLIERFGPFAVVFCFLTIGLQTAVLAISGVTRMPFGRFLPAVSLGALLWAIAYGTIGLAVVQAWVLAATGSWWGVLILAALAAIGALLWWRHRQLTRRSERLPSSTAPSDAA